MYNVMMITTALYMFIPGLFVFILEFIFICLKPPIPYWIRVILKTFYGLMIIMLLFVIIRGFCNLHYMFNTTSVSESQEKYEVFNISLEQANYVNEDGKTITAKVYDICENTFSKKDYAVKITEEYNAPSIVKKMTHLNCKEKIRIYTNNIELLKYYQKEMNFTGWHIIYIPMTIYCYLALIKIIIDLIKDKNISFFKRKIS